jgi:tetratricopeptide (TPR) repeat protein
MATPHSSPWAMIASATILLSVAFAHPLPGFADQSVTLKGQVLTKDGQVIPSGATISLETEEGGMMGSRPADAFGSYTFEGIPPGKYHLTVTADKFQIYQQDVDLDFRQVSYTVNVYLTPANKTVVKVPPALTDEAAPKTARKEFEKGKRALEENKMAEARRHLEKAVADYPCYARAQASLAQVDLHDRKADSAEACFKKAIQCDGSFLDSFSELAQLYIVEKKFVESENVLNQGLRLSPQAWLFHYEMGQAHYGMQKYPESVQDYLLAQSLHPEMPAKFHIKLGTAYLRTEAYPQALAEFQTYLHLEPNGQYAAAAREAADKMLKGGVTAAAAPPPPGTPPPPKP